MSKSKGKTGFALCRKVNFLPNSSRPLIYFVSIMAVLSIITVSFLSGCQSNSIQNPAQKSILNVGLLLGSGGLGDKSFNDSAYLGLTESQKKYNIRFETAESISKESNLASLRLFARNKYDLIIGIAFENLEYIQTVAAEFPNIKFALIDAELNGPNITSVVYREQEGDFLMGVLAAMVSKTGSVGVIGGTDIPAIRRIMSGFKQGANYQDNRVKVFTDFAGTFNDPQVGFDLAVKRYNEGADVIHNAASKTGLGIIQAAQQVKKWTTGTSGDQRSLAPGNMLGNRPKRVDTAVEVIISDVVNGKFTSGVRSLGLKENGLSIGPFDESVVTPTITNRLADLQRKIINGEITVQAE